VKVVILEFASIDRTVAEIISTGAVWMSVPEFTFIAASIFLNKDT